MLGGGVSAGVNCGKQNRKGDEAKEEPSRKKGRTRKERGNMEGKIVKCMQNEKQGCTYIFENKPPSDKGGIPPPPCRMEKGRKEKGKQQRGKILRKGNK